MTSEPPRLAPLALEAVAQALAFLVKAVEESEPAGDGDGQDIEYNVTHLDRLAWRRQVAGEALQRAAQTEAALFRRRRNALIPINRLPSELLSAILIQSVDECRSYRIELLHGLAQVAWQWWQTIKSNPQFWAHITGPMENVELQIRRAGNLPLRLDWCSVDAEDPGAFKDLLQRHAERWRIIDHAETERRKKKGRRIDPEGDDVALQALCTSPFPRLEYLKVRRESSETSGVWRFDLANFQNLREAHLPIVPSFSVSPTSNSPSLLQTLHLDLFPEDSHSLYDLESLLRYTPQLIELEVQNLYDDTSPPSSVDTAIINLPMLRHLRFSNVVSGEERDEIPLLAQIRAPLLERFGLRYSISGWRRAIDIGGRTIFDELVTRPLASLSRSEDAPLYSILRNAGPSASWTVKVSDDEARITAKVSDDEDWSTAKSNGKGLLDINCSREDDILQYILQPLAMFALPVDLDLGCWDGDTELAFWDDVLDATPLLRSFTLDCPLQVAQQIMDRLCTKAASPSSTSPRAPLLEKVHFRHELSGGREWSEDDVGEAVKTMLESRRNLFIQGGALDPPKLVITEPYGAVFDEVEGRWVMVDWTLSLRES